MSARTFHTIAFVALAALLGAVARAQAPVSENFTGATTTNDWYFFNGACLTAGTSTSTTSPGSVPACTTVLKDYYSQRTDGDQYLVGGADGYLGSSSAPASIATQKPDPVTQGALRFTNGYPYGHQENGAIISADTFPTGSGIHIQFETVTYHGDSGGGDSDGADGISFFLMDGSVPFTTYPDDFGAFGGSLGYTCTDETGNYDSTTRSDGSVRGYDGIVGGYIGLGIDEYGNFLNQGDNTASGDGYQPNRIGLRGAGSISWKWLTNTYPAQYPNSLSATQAAAAVHNTCQTGRLWDYSDASSPRETTTPVMDYQAIPNAYVVLPSSTKIANESASTRAKATPITYDLKITQDGLLSLSYSIDGGATQQVLTNQSITASNGSLPSSFRFGFAGSTGGSTNIHEILCFKAEPNSVSASSAGVNQKQSAQIQTGTYAYFAYYDPDNWTGRVTANALGTDSSGGLTIATTPAWDASCVLTGGSCASTGATGLTAESPSSRVVLTWNGTQGIPFEWSDLTTAQQNALDATDSTETAYRLDYLRGDRTNEVDSSATCPVVSSLSCLRARDEVLGDVVDSSPTWVGAPSSAYSATWSDSLNPSATAAENATGAQSYSQFVAAEETREHVVYVGANDGLLHGFRAGADTSGGTFDTTAPNDGYEVLAYMPGAVISGATLTTGSGTTESVVDTIHGIDPTNSNAVTTDDDFSNTQYGHNFTVDATPGSGDLFYDGAWHTWLVGGLGAGGADIYALDVTSPANFSETNAASLVIGEWSAATISCTNVSDCGLDLGDTYGTPVIRRTHALNGSGENEWAVIWGNGFGSSSGDAGIFIMTIDPASGAKTIYYLSTGTAGTGNGIASVTPADLDGDHTTDYVYAGDLNGDVWRFDLTSSNPSSWGIQRCLDAACTTTTSAPLFKTSTGQPITSQLVLATGATPAGATTLMIAFGTGEKQPFSNVGSATYASGTQSLYGVWDWALLNWNSKSTPQYAALSAGSTGIASPYTVSPSNLQEQTFTVNTGNNDRDVAANAVVCWQGTSACSTGSNDQFGWYLNLPGTASQGPEQIIYNPVLVDGAFVVNSTVPPNSTLLSCDTLTETGYTYALPVLNGGGFDNFFPLYNDASAAGVATDATGTPFSVLTGNGQYYLVYQTTQGGETSGTTTGTGSTNTGVQECDVLGGNCQKINPSNGTGHRVTWIQLR